MGLSDSDLLLNLHGHGLLETGNLGLEFTGIENSTQKFVCSQSGSTGVQDGAVRHTTAAIRGTTTLIREKT